MDPRVEKILKLPAYQRIGLLACMLVLIGGALVYFLIVPQYGKLNDLQERNEQLQVRIEQDQAIVKKLPQFKAEYEKMKDQLDQALTELPNQKEIPALLTSIASVAKENGLDVLRFKPGNEQAKGFYAEVPVELKLAGSYHQAALFFDAVSNLSRIVNINNLTMGGAKGGGRSFDLSVDCMAVTFRFVEESEKSEPKGKKGKR